MSLFRVRPLACCVLLAVAGPAGAVKFDPVNLVTDDASVHPAQIVDPMLKNAWGMSFSATSPFWVSAADGGVSTTYSVDPGTQATTKMALTVSVSGGPTGQVFNGSSGFNGDRFLFVSEDGSVHGWRGALGSTAETLVTGLPGNSYKGAAIGTLGSSSYLYGANFQAGSIDVFKGDPGDPNLAGNFIDPALPAGYAPFNVRNLGNTLYVTYAFKTDPGDDEETKGAGLGLVDAFDLNGVWQGRIATGGSLNAPWGLAVAPSSFGAWAGSLLVGNFGDGRINAYDAATHAFLGQVAGADGSPLAIDGLWAISPGNDGSAGSSALLYFTAGPDDEAHGLFGVLSAVPESSTAALLLLGLGCLGGDALRRRRAG